MSNSAQTAASYSIMLSQSRERKVLMMTLGCKVKRTIVIKAPNDRLAAQVEGIPCYKRYYFMTTE